MLSAVLHENRRRAEVFGDDAEQYDRSRPAYPDGMLDQVLSGWPDRPIEVLDVGCGTGIAARQLERRGCSVLGLEPDQRMGAVARRRGLDVVTGRFENWDSGGRIFDLLTAGQSWHWVEPFEGARRAGQVLRPGGRIALFWNHGAPDPQLQRAFDRVYERLALELDRDSLLLRGQRSERFDIVVDGLRRSGFFSEPEITRYPWSHEYGAEEWLDQIQTHSDHRLLPKQKLSQLLEGLAETINTLGGTVPVDYRTWLINAERRAR